MSSVEFPVQTIMVPGRGLVNLDAMRVDTAVREYDERLRFGFNPVNQDWCVYIRLPRDYEGAPYHIDGEPVMVVLGFQDKIPSPEQATKRLYETDALRHGSKLLDKMNAENDRLRAEREEARSEQMQEAAERMEHVMRKYGKSPISKTYFQKGINPRRGYRVGARGR